jgi:hypothetical protein
MTTGEIEPEATPEESPQAPEAAATASPQEQGAALTASRPVPWEDAGLTRLQGLGRTLKQVLFYPGDFFQSLSREGWREALGFGLIVGTAGVLVCLYWQLLFYLGLSRLLGPMPAATRLFLMGSGAIMTMMLLAPVIVLGNLLISTLGIWVAVGLTGGPRSVFVPVWRIACYAQGAMVAGVMPLLGGAVAGLWGLFLTFRGLQKVLGLSSWRALGVLCLSLGLQILLVVLLLGSLWGLRLLRG